MKRKAISILFSILMISNLCGCQKSEVSVGADKKAENTMAAEDSSSKAEEGSDKAVEDGNAEEDKAGKAEDADANSQDRKEAKETVHVANPSWDYYIAGDTASDTTPLKLVKASEDPNKITDDIEWFEKNNFTRPENKDESYTYEIDKHKPCLIKVKDNKSDKIIADLDFSEYEYADDFKAEDKEFAQQEINYAKVQGNMLYVSIGHNTYAKTSPHNAYIAAINLDTMSVVWKTEPLACNSYNFEIAGKVILCGYGFTEEDDYLKQIDINTGKIIDTIPLKSKADYIIRKDNLLYVRCYDTDYTFKIEGM